MMVEIIDSIGPLTRPFSFVQDALEVIEDDGDITSIALLDRDQVMDG